MSVRLEFTVQFKNIMTLDPYKPPSIEDGSRNGLIGAIIGLSTFFYSSLPTIFLALHYVKYGCAIETGSVRNIQVPGMLFWTYLYVLMQLVFGTPVCIWVRRRLLRLYPNAKIGAMFATLGVISFMFSISLTFFFFCVAPYLSGLTLEFDHG